MAAPPRSPSVARRLGSVIADRYRIESLLGQGGMGAVYAAVHVLTQRPVALKILESAHAKDTSRKQRFLREAQAAVRLAHPHVVEVLDMGETADGALFLALELLRGRTLDEELRQRKKLPLSECLEILLPVMSALAAAHRIGLIHRDVKPANVFLHRDLGNRLVPKLLDFGIAKDLEAITSGARTSAGTILGTPNYVAPELIDGGKVRPAADVWSMGVVFYRCLVGRPPFEGETPVAVMMAIASGAYKPLAEAGPDLPPDVVATLGRALERDPKVRYPDMGAFFEALAPVALGHGINSDDLVPPEAVAPKPSLAPEAPPLADSQPTPPSTRLPARVSTETVNRALLAGAVALGLLVLGLVLYIAWPSGAPAPLVDGTGEPDAGVVVLTQAERRDAALGLIYWPAGDAALAAPGSAAPDARAPDAAALDAAAPDARAPDAAAPDARAPDAAAPDARAPDTAAAALVEDRRDAGAAVMVRASVSLEPRDAAAAPPLPELQVVPPKKQAKTHFDRAQALRREGRREEAVEALTEAVKLAPDFVAAYNARGLLHQEAGRLDRAAADLGRAIELEPDNAVLCYNRGLLWMQKKDWAAARADFTRALAVDPRSAAYARERGMAALAMKDYPAAVADLDQAIKREPRAVSYLARGTAEQERGRHREAAADFGKALELDGASVEARYRRGRSLAEVGDAEGAVRDFGEVIRRDPGHAPAHLRRGLAYVRLGRRAEARRDLLRYLELDPKSDQRAAVLRQLERLPAEGGFPGR